MRETTLTSADLGLTAAEVGFAGSPTWVAGVDELRPHRTPVVVREDDAGRAVPRTSEKDHVEIIFLDQPVQMNIDERQSRTRAPVPQQAILEVLRP